MSRAEAGLPLGNLLRGGVRKRGPEREREIKRGKWRREDEKIGEKKRGRKDEKR